MTTKENNRETSHKFQVLIERLKSLKLSADQFALFGSGPMAVRGMREPGDLDVVVTKELFVELSKKYPADPSWHGGKIKAIAEDIDVYDATAAPIPAETLIERAEVFEGIRFLTLEDTIAAKRVQNREKDLKDIEIIEAYLQAGGK